MILKIHNCSFKRKNAGKSTYLLFIQLFLSSNNKAKQNGLVMEKITPSVSLTELKGLKLWQGPAVSIEQQLKIYLPFTNQEIRDTIFFSLNANSPGPYGYSSGFFRACWSSIGPLTCDDVHEFFDIDVMANLAANLTKSQIVFEGCNSQLQQLSIKITGLKVSRVPIITSKLGNVKSRAVVDKIMAKVKFWSSKTTSYAGRALLISTILFAMFNFWVSIFLIPQERSSHGITAYYLQAKGPRGLGIKNFSAKNKACISQAYLGCNFQERSSLGEVGA
ncbi:hypothetical protein Cgig2_032158 [Carnegiea gigantea]|uniref:Uncharacterized protein n=1 Tax=Carnegiea gigantea TaxID=171969 RepID=A0A9Q1JTF1_9CARY|nr:hypothetical protein Cgig2_032158 [Carnegiea gigantea]